MVNSTLQITYQSVLTDSNLVIEQEQYPAPVQMNARRTFYYMIDNYYSGSLTSASSDDCNEDTTSTIIYAFPSPFDLEYTLHTSHGSLSNYTISDESTEQYYTVNFEDSVKVGSATVFDLQQPVLKWIYGPKNSSGVSIPTPTWSVVDGIIVFNVSEPFYAKISIQYIRRKHTYTLSLPVRDAIEHQQQATVYGIYNNKISHHEIEEPPEQNVVSCVGSGGGSVVIIEDEDPPDSPNYTDKHINYDYCTGCCLSSDCVSNKCSDNPDYLG